MADLNVQRFGDRYRIVIDCAFQIQDVVVLVVDPSNNKGVVIGYAVRPGGVLYDVAWDSLRVQSHYEFELRHPTEPTLQLTIP